MSRRYAVMRLGRDQLWCDGKKFYVEWVESDEVDVWSEERQRFEALRGFDGMPLLTHAFHRKYFGSDQRDAIRDFRRWHEERMPHEET